MFDFRDKVVVVTGAAGNVGRAVVGAFLEAGGTVCSLDHRSGRLVGLFTKDRGQGYLHIYENVDLCERKAMMSLGERIVNEVGQIDVLVNTVGSFSMGEKVHELSPETLDQMMRDNVTSLLNAKAAFVPSMLETGHGKIVSIGAEAALKGGAKMGAYAAAKSVVLRLTESMAAELQDNNIQVNCILPGTIDTPENRQAMPDADFEKWVTPKQVAETILFLSSSSADGITGVSLPVKGRP